LIEKDEMDESDGGERNNNKFLKLDFEVGFNISN